MERGRLIEWADMMDGWTAIMILGSYPPVPYHTDRPKKEFSYHHNRHRNHHTASVPVPVPIKMGNSWSPLRYFRILSQNIPPLNCRNHSASPSFRCGSRAKHIIPAEEKTESEWVGYGKLSKQAVSFFYFYFLYRMLRTNGRLPALCWTGTVPLIGPTKTGNAVKPFQPQIARRNK